MEKIALYYFTTYLEGLVKLVIIEVKLSLQKKNICVFFLMQFLDNLVIHVVFWIFYLKIYILISIHFFLLVTDVELIIRSQPFQTLRHLNITYVIVHISHWILINLDKLLKCLEWFRLQFQTLLKMYFRFFLIFQYLIAFSKQILNLSQLLFVLSAFFPIFFQKLNRLFILFTA